MVRTLIKNATLLTMDPGRPGDPFRGDILIDGELIAGIGPDLEAPAGAEVIDGTDKLVTPGLINAHLHSVAAFHRGRTDNLPLELAMLYIYPLIGREGIPERLIRLRSLLVAMESLKNGVTCLVDDVLELPVQTMDTLGAMVDAYAEIGIRANCSGHIIDRPYVDSMPYTDEVLPPDVLAEARSAPMPSVEASMEFAREAIHRFHGKGRFRYVIAPSGPQRCTAELMLAAAELSAEHDIPFHTHILETKGQAVTGLRFHGKSLLKYINDLGILNERTAIAHGIWFDQEDIELVAAAGASVMHPVLSNLKTGAGIAPLRQMLAAGVNLGLGTDSIVAAGTARMFDVMKAAALIHKPTTPSYWNWPRAMDILHMATLGGARSARIGDITGSLEVGKQADLVIFDATTYNFIPFHDADKHLVYSENGTSVETVMVGGEVVVRDRRLTRIDEAEVLGEIRQELPAITGQYLTEESVGQNLLEKYYAEINRRCNAEDVGINRYIEPEESWAGELAEARFV
jgi:5-methylthioadenosine/S-adenosylhomocysteine deaminase